MSTVIESGPSVAERDDISADERAALDAHWRAANFPGTAQIDHLDNVLLEEPLGSEHIKPRLLGHGGAVPGVNFLYSHLNRLNRAQDADILLVLAASPRNRAVAAAPDAVAARYERELADARAFAEAHGVDPPEIADWSWSDGEA